MESIIVRYNVSSLFSDKLLLIYNVSEYFVNSLTKNWTGTKNGTVKTHLSEIFRDVQDKYMQITGNGATLDPNIISSSATSYFRNKKYNDKPDVKEKKKRKRQSP